MIILYTDSGMLPW